MEMEHRFRLAGIRESEIVYVCLYPNQRVLVNKIVNIRADQFAVCRFEKRDEK